ncbi:MAG: cob(I)yrinic acid a,c-diamide adenosyltransferase [Deltaproteobacteria bacterium]|nr:cob(I)yrinic acid a,c-diamide adenosyltransferase [Deltaproteobacteria bacterium]MBW1954792.1 cob(I)yrinic acid a,c-diamide adenosyltransferase [Deltaproteobacteria bacterium]MBW2040663.1 cob(I)yrinic acid a,c-diamide adenosyltransferase [Deltaproteobacteria bacterium]MBW2132487.1 cob(I)yrinic acid a,c-diamide adenosyltransferase [Deltaproteobacteria bacterium]
MQTNGLLMIFTGNGKGKTTAAVGLALRAAGHGFPVLFLQFMKGQRHIGEILAFKRNPLPIHFRQYGRPGFVQSRACEPLDVYLAHQALEACRTQMAAGAYQMIVLDEINVAVDFGLLRVDEVLAVLKMRPSNLHLVLTGRNAPPAFMDLADLVTEMKEIKHPYQKKIRAQKGIEF